jgi:flagellar basal-body rod protein FlgG
MNGAFYIGAVGLDAQQQSLNVVANNIANINTTAFKRQTVQFSNLVVPAQTAGTSTGGVAPTTGAGAYVGATPFVWSQGTLTQTGQPLDLAIQGDGFLQAMGPGGADLLWRGGTLTIDANGRLATSGGQELSAMISVPATAQNLTIGTNGVVSAQLGSGAVKELGQLQVALAKDPSALVAAGNGYYQCSDPGQMIVVTPGQEGGGQIIQGSLEGSNVTLTDEMVNLMLVQRAYGANAQVVQAGDQLASIVNQLRR